MDANLGVQLLGHGTGGGHAQALGVLVGGETGGQQRFGVGAPVIGGNQQQRRLRVQLAEFTGQVVAGQAGTDDDYRCAHRSEEHTSELQSLMRNSSAVFCLKKKKKKK